MTWMASFLIQRRYIAIFGMEAGREAGYDWKMEHSLMLRSMAPEFAEPMMKEVFGQDFGLSCCAEQAQGVDGCLYGNASGREKCRVLMNC